MLQLSRLAYTCLEILTPTLSFLIHDNFTLLQETEVTYVHDGGALMFFLSGVIYIVLQTKISYVIYPPGSSANTFRARVVITIIAIFAFFPSILKSAIKQRKSLACIFPASAFYKSLLSLSENTAVICAFFVKQTQLHRHKEDKVRKYTKKCSYYSNTTDFSL